MRSILVYADRSPSMAARLETGLAIARMTSGHITVLVDTPIQRYVAMDPMGGSYVASEALHQALAQDEAQAGEIEAQLAGQDVTFDVVHSEDEPLDALASAARLADLVVLSRSTNLAGNLAGELAMASRTPVLVLPDRERLEFPLARAMIAWDGGNEAALALRCAVPLLAGCAAVTLATVTEKPGGFPAIDAASYLSRHGIGAEVTELTRKGSAEETLATEAARAEAGLLIMGAYGKSRMREYLFGGVTRYFLEECSRPALLLAH
jgi:nucleotide-binding universal stress UspA family protein